MRERVVLTSLYILHYFFSQEEKTLDPFVIHNPTYSPLREGMTTAAYGRDYKALEDSSAVRHSNNFNSV